MKLYMVGGIIMFFSLASADYPLFTVYPLLASKINRVAFGVFPTPVERLENLGGLLGLSQLYAKREDLNNAANKMGGNKVRKLELLLPAAKAAGAEMVVTFGGVGSNHVAATACYAPQLGLDCVALLTTQPFTAEVPRNILLDYSFGARIFMCSNDRVPCAQELTAFLKDKGITKQYSVIPMGGSNKEGVISQINAVFELKEQIKAGIMPEPDYVYVAFGSMGTTAGLIMGIKLAGLKTQVRAVRVASREKYNASLLLSLMHETNTFLRALDSSIPDYTYEQGWDIIDDFLGKGFAHTTTETEEAIVLFKTTQDLILDCTYTGKAAAALIADARNGFLKPSNVVLFWHTFCATDFNQLTRRIDYHQLPEVFHQYFS